MNIREKIFAPSALYAVTGIRDGTFRAQKQRGVYAALGILADGTPGPGSPYSLEQLVALEIVLKLNKFGPTLEEAVALVSSIIPDFDLWIAEAKKKADEAVARQENQEEFLKFLNWAGGARGFLSAPFCLQRIEPEKGPAHWQLSPVDGGETIGKFLAPLKVAILIDAGRIAAEVVWKLVHGGAMRASEL